MRVILHIGTEKTGTTSLQEFLHVNRARLLNHGVAYLQSPGLRNHRGVASFCSDDVDMDDYFLAHKLHDRRARERWRRQFKQRFDKEIRALPASVDTVIISSEHLSSLLIRPEELARLQDLLAPHFSPIEIVVYLRRQDKLACSIYSTRLKVGDPGEHIFHPTPASSNRYNYQSLLDRWSERFGKSALRVRVFEKKRLQGGDLITDFLGLLPVGDDTQFRRPQKHNEALSSEAQELLKILNEHMPKRLDGKLNPLDPFRVEFIQKLSAELPGKPLLPPMQEAIDFYHIFSASNQEVATQWFDGRFFDEDFSSYQQAPLDQYSKEQVSIALIKAMSETVTSYSKRLKSLRGILKR